MDIIISNADGRPIYEQIYSAVKEKIISGEIKAGEPLPSIRALAKDLRIMCGIGRQELMEMYDIIKKENTGESY